MLESKELQKLMKFDNLFVGFSGGLDSSVLLHVLASQTQLSTKIKAIHVNHSYSKNSDLWQNQCINFCNNLKIPIISEKINLFTLANLEERARIARYKIFADYIINKQCCLLLAHNKNDQAETLLLQLMRGTGIDGLCAMKNTMVFGNGFVYRPFLYLEREVLKTYAKQQKMTKWIEDESNFDINFSRNYIRHQAIPLLQKRWPKIIDSLVRTSLHCQQSLANLEALAKIDCPEISKNFLNCDHFINLSHDRISNVIRVWLKNNFVKAPNTLTFQRIISELLFVSTDARPLITWGKYSIKRYGNKLYLFKNNQKIDKNTLSFILQPLTRNEKGVQNHGSNYDETIVKREKTDYSWKEFPLELTLGKELGHLIARRADEGLRITSNSKITIRFRQGGEVFIWHKQTKKLKKLFQEWAIPPWLRDQIPLVYLNNHLACIVGYAISDLFYCRGGEQVWQLENVKPAKYGDKKIIQKS